MLTVSRMASLSLQLLHSGIGQGDFSASIGQPDLASAALGDAGGEPFL